MRREKRRKITAFFLYKQEKRDKKCFFYFLSIISIILPLFLLL